MSQLRSYREYLFCRRTGEMRIDRGPGWLAVSGLRSLIHASRESTAACWRRYDQAHIASRSTMLTLRRDIGVLEECCSNVQDRSGYWTSAIRCWSIALEWPDVFSRTRDPLP